MTPARKWTLTSLIVFVVFTVACVLIYTVDFFHDSASALAISTANPSLLIKPVPVPNPKSTSTGTNTDTDTGTGTDTNTGTGTDTNTHTSTQTPAPPLNSIPTKKRSRSKSIQVGVGIENLGVTCFANALIQLLYHCPDFRIALKTYVDRRRTMVVVRDPVTRQAQALEKIFSKLDKAQNTKMTFVTVKTHKFLPSELHSGQQDTGELLQHVFKYPLDWEKFFIRYTPHTVRDYAVQGQATLPVKSEGGTVKDIQLPLDIPKGQNNTMQSLLDAFFREREQDRSTRDVDEGVTRSCTSHTIEHFPKNLFLRLLRFEMIGSECVKKCDRIPAETEISLEEFRGGSGISGSSRYQLVGFAAHLGTRLTGGHYIAYIRNSTNTGWIEFNDRQVTAISDCDFNNSQAHGCIYLYRQVPDEEHGA